MEVDQPSKPLRVRIPERARETVSEEFPEDVFSNEELYQAVRAAVMSKEERIVPQVEDLYDYITDEVVGVNTLSLLIKANKDIPLVNQPPVVEPVAHTIGRRLVERLPRTQLSPIWQGIVYLQNLKEYHIHLVKTLGTSPQGRRYNPEDFDEVIRFLHTLPDSYGIPPESPKHSERWYAAYNAFLHQYQVHLDPRGGYHPFGNPLRPNDYLTSCVGVSNLHNQHVLNSVLKKPPLGSASVSPSPPTVNFGNSASQGLNCNIGNSDDSNLPNQATNGVAAPHISSHSASAPLDGRASNKAAPEGRSMHLPSAQANPSAFSSDAGVNSKVLSINISPETIARIKARVEFTAKHALIGQIQGANPAQRDLQHWAEDNLPRSFDRLVVKRRGFFEIQFSAEEGRTEALSKTSYTYQGRPVTFKVWTPHFKPDDEVDKPQLKFPVWVQINELPMVFRSSDYLEEVVSQFAQVVMVEDSTEYRARFMGPRVRILTNNVEVLPKKITLPR